MKGLERFSVFLDRLFDEIVPVICRFPRSGRSFLNRTIKSTRAAALAPQLDDLLPKGHDLREMIADDYFILYVVGRPQIAFLAIKHHRQLSFDLKHFWQNE